MSVSCRAKLTQADEAVLNKFQGELVNAWPDNEAIKKLCRQYLTDYPELEFVSGSGTPQGTLEDLRKESKIQEEQVTIFDNCVPDKLGHGGRRKGAGRKQGVPTKVMRIPEPLVDAVKKMLEEYKTSES